MWFCYFFDFFQIIAVQSLKHENVEFLVLLLVFLYEIWFLVPIRWRNDERRDEDDVCVNGASPGL